MTTGWSTSTSNPHSTTCIGVPHADGTGWSAHHDLDATLDEIGRVAPGDVDGYRRYAKAAMPAVRMIFEAAAEPPSVTGLTRVALRRRLAGTPALLRWSRRSAADVLREFFDDEIVRGPGATTGPMVWGISPEFEGSGLGALSHAMRHVARVGRPVGGSGRVPETLRASFEAAGGAVRTGHARGGDLLHRRIGEWRSPRRRVVGLGSHRRVGVQSTRHLPAMAEASPGRGS